MRWQVRALDMMQCGVFADAERMERSAVTIQAHGRGFVARRKTARHRLGLASLTAIHERMAALTAVQIGHFEEQQIKQSGRISASKLSVHAKVTSASSGPPPPPPPLPDTRGLSRRRLALNRLSRRRRPSKPLRLSASLVLRPTRGGNGDGRQSTGGPERS